MTLVDTNVLLDLVTDDPDWADWSLARLEEAAMAGPALVNDIVYAETSRRHAAVEGWPLLARAPDAQLPLFSEAHADSARGVKRSPA